MIFNIYRRSSDQGSKLPWSDMKNKNKYANTSYLWCVCDFGWKARSSYFSISANVRNFPTVKIFFKMFNGWNYYLKIYFPYAKCSITISSPRPYVSPEENISSRFLQERHMAVGTRLVHCCYLQIRQMTVESGYEALGMERA